MRDAAAREAALEALGTQLKIRYGDKGAIRTISGSLNLPPPDPENLPEIESQLLEYLRIPLGLKDAESFTNARIIRSVRGQYTLKLAQMIDGLPVIGGSIAIRYDADHKPLTISSYLALDENLRRDVQIDMNHAAQAAADATRSPQSEVAFKGTRPTYLRQKDEVVLVWETIVRQPSDSPSGGPVRVFVDANSGEIVAIWPTRAHGKHRIAHDADYSNSYEPGSPEIEEGGSTSGVDEHALNAYDYAGDTYDVLTSVFDHQTFVGSTKNGNEAIRITVNYCNPPTTPPENCSYNNAFFEDDSAGSGDIDEMRIVFGVGDDDIYGNYADSRDMVAHEYAHGVTHTFGPIGYVAAQAGAINEAYSDIIAAIVHEEIENEIDWSFAEDVYRPGNSTALRYLDEPRKDCDTPLIGCVGNPMDDFDDPDFDNVSHHDRAGVANLAFALLVEGGGHPRGINAAEVEQGIGIDKAREIFFDAVSNLPENNSAEFKDLRERTALSANLLYGTTEEGRVHQAFDVVNVPGSPNVPPEMPASISKTHWYCYGWYTIDWPDSEGATGYDLRHSETGADFDNGTILYVGGSTSVNVNVESTGYVGVKACNTSGCSGFKGPLFVERLVTCQ
ncbi:MAG: M4 family metallopeptidase [Gammaproteobacteria bacterium]